MKEQEIIAMMDAYDELQASAQLLSIQEADLRAQALPMVAKQWFDAWDIRKDNRPDFKQLQTMYETELLHISQEIGNAREVVSGKVATLKAEIEKRTLEHGETVHSAHWMCVWSKGREGSFDTKRLIGYAAAHPELLQFKKEDGKPTASLQVSRRNDG